MPQNGGQFLIHLTGQVFCRARYYLGQGLALFCLDKHMISPLEAGEAGIIACLSKRSETKAIYGHK